MDAPPVPHPYHNFPYRSCDPSAVTMPHVGGVGPVNPGVDPVRPHHRHAAPSTTIRGQPPPSSQLPLVHSGPTLAPESSASPLPNYHATPSHDVLPSLTPPSADPYNSMWSSFPPQAFQGAGWQSEQGEPHPDDHWLPLSLVPPAGENLDNYHANVQGYIHGEPMTFAAVPIPNIHDDQATPNPRTYHTAAVPPLIHVEQVPDALSMGRSRTAHGAKGTNPESTQKPIGGSNADLGVPLIQGINWHQPSSTTIDHTNGTKASSGTPEGTGATSGPVRSVPSTSRARHRSEQTVLDRPGKRPPAEYEADPVALKRRCERRGGKSSATAWIESAFQTSVNVEALVRRLTQSDIEDMNFQGGFGPAQAYDGFLEKEGTRFACGLCHASKRMSWKNKKDAVPHLRKFHFGLADHCGVCNKKVYSTGEMTSHPCVLPRRNGI